MIELGDLFNRCIPIDTLLRMPRKFVIRLRELRRFQKEQQAKQQMQQMNQMNSGGPSSVPAVASRAFDSTAIDEIVDELS